MIPAPRDVPATLTTLVAAALAAVPHTAILGDDEVEILRGLQADFDATMPNLLCNPFEMAKKAFTEQQALIGAGKKVADAFTVEEFKGDIFLRVAAARDRLIQITIEARKFAVKANAKIVPILQKLAAEIEASEREAHAKYGIDKFLPSCLVLAMKDAPRRITQHVPRGDMPCASPRGFVFGIHL